ncbi:MAG: carboxylating nicotinate-nucleotide diphosphorylase [Candidatus Omnitrophica bacterium]|nr:carboxylating nicotinate-nucleotide diphosphorylase [Candidatus Omnitrophota bacterium]
MPSVNALIRQALEEDRAAQDLTSRLLLPPSQHVEGVILAKQPGIVAGVQVCRDTFLTLNRRIRCAVTRRDGQPVRAGQTILSVRGPARAIFAAERTALNFLGHLSGIATLTARFVQRVTPHRVAILDTRKTIPGLRDAEKSAVRSGGGHSHRLHLADAILIKTNHLKALGKPRSEAIWAAVARAKRARPSRDVIVEAANLAEFRAALAMRPDVILLDNWTAPVMRQAVRLRNAIGRRPLLEASGGVTLANIRAIAATGVERISIGRLTHSAPALDVSLRIS